MYVYIHNIMYTNNTTWCMCLVEKCIHKKHYHHKQKLCVRCSYYKVKYQYIKIVYVQNTEKILPFIYNSGY